MDIKGVQGEGGAAAQGGSTPSTEPRKNLGRRPSRPQTPPHAPGKPPRTPGFGRVSRASVVLAEFGSREAAISSCGGLAPPAWFVYIRTLMNYKLPCRDGIATALVLVLALPRPAVAARQPSQQSRNKVHNPWHALEPLLRMCMVAIQDRARAPLRVGMQTRRVGVFVWRAAW